MSNKILPSLALSDCYLSSVYKLVSRAGQSSSASTFSTQTIRWQDDLLRAAVQKATLVNNGVPNWRLVAEYMNRVKTSIQCRRRWKILTVEPSPNLTPWTPHEVSPSPLLAMLPLPPPSSQFSCLRITFSRRPMDLSSPHQERQLIGVQFQRKLVHEQGQSVAKDGPASPEPIGLIGSQTRFLSLSLSLLLSPS